MMNEPHRGYIDLKSFHSFDYNVDLHLSHMREYSRPVPGIHTEMITTPE